jgi:hypothetical protein
MTADAAGTPPHLSEHHRDTVERILEHPSSSNVEWHSVVSLLDAVAEVEQRHDGKLKVSLGGQTVVLTRPRGKDVSTQQVVDLRHLLVAAGLGAVGRRGHEA